MSSTGFGMLTSSRKGCKNINGCPMGQLTLLTEQIEAISQTLLSLNENIIDQLKSVENGQLYFTLAKVKGKCEKLIEQESIQHESSHCANMKSNDANVQEQNVSDSLSKPVQKFLQNYRATFNLDGFKNEIEDSSTNNSNASSRPAWLGNVENGFWSVECEKCGEQGHFGNNCNQDTKAEYSNAYRGASTEYSKSSPSNSEANMLAQFTSLTYYDKSKSFYDSISTQNYAQNMTKGYTERNRQNVGNKEKNIQTFGTDKSMSKASYQHTNIASQNKNKSANSEKPGVPPQLRQLSSECVQLLSKAPNGTLSFKKFLTEYHDHFGYAVNEVDQKIKLIELLEEMPTIVTIVRHLNEELHIKLTRKNEPNEPHAGDKKYSGTSDAQHEFEEFCCEVLKDAPSHKLSFNAFTKAYYDYYGEQFKASYYGYNKLSDLFEAIPATVKTIKYENGFAYVKLVDAGS